MSFNAFDGGGYEIVNQISSRWKEDRECYIDSYALVRIYVGAPAFVAVHRNFPSVNVTIREYLISQDDIQKMPHIIIYDV